MPTETVSTAVEKAQTGAIATAWAYQDRFAAVLPDHIDTKSFLGLAAGALYRDKDLMDAANANQGSFMNALLRCATLGHQPGTEEFYLTPRKVKGKPSVLGIEGYRGIVERMYRSGAVASVIVREVCKNDHFEFIEGVHDKPVHKVDWFGGDRGEMIGVYAYAILTTGAVSRVVVLSKADVMAAKAKSDGADSPFSPWNSKEDGGRSMWWKTAARRLDPWVPTSAEYRREQLRAIAEAHNVTTHSAAVAPAGVDTDTGEIHDAEIVDDGPLAFDDPARLDVEDGAA